MGEPKAFASLSSGLLARKGQAKPAMRPQGFGGFGMSPAALEDLGWNDMGTGPAHAGQGAEIVPFALPAEPVMLEAEEQPRAAPAIAQPELPAVVVQQAQLTREWTPAAESVEVRVRPSTVTKAKAAFTLRLDPERHLKLRLTAAVSHRSAQAIVVAALDAYLDTHAPAAALGSLQ